MNKIQQIENRVKYIEEKGFSIGLTVDDYYTLREISTQISRLSANRVGIWNDLQYKVDELSKKISDAGLLNEITKNNFNYIINNSYILPLALANDEDKVIRLSHDNGYRLKCPFHKENYPSMLVLDLSNSYACTNCSCSGNVINYIQRYERIMYKDAIKLLAQIYLFDMGIEDSRFKDLVEKYHELITSDIYLEALKSGYERLVEKKIKEVSEKDIEVEYANRYKMIDRIRNNQFDDNFVYEEPPKIMYLKKE